MPESANNKGGAHIFQEHNENFFNGGYEGMVTDNLKCNIKHWLKNAPNGIQNI
ncbi:protein of unknown function [Candidatus Nitrotoga arctica]|uniref:Uncharacterized protein n=1 Tax=Candidatus Nitrotoga arctica TaxID=453162 RepID=A0ABN8AQJ8_9PROT|nr:protein of unknown function [Candidatus Nitrotoga arctica]